MELLGCCLCTSKALAWAACAALPAIPIPPSLNGFHYPCLECRRHFFQPVIYIYKQSEKAEEADAGVSPPKSQLTPGNCCPTWEAGEGWKNPLSHPHFPGLFPAEKAQAPLCHHFLLSFTILQLPALLFCSMCCSALLPAMLSAAPAQLHSLVRLSRSVK